MKCNLDYETRSECDLPLCGVHVYAKHPSTRVLCCSYSIDGGPIKTWYAWGNHEFPDDLWAAMQNPKCEMHAWNAQFERLISRDVLGVDIPLDRWRCTAALSRARGAPGKLERALEYFDMAHHLDHKRRGGQIMRKWMKPQVDGTWADSPQEYAELCVYCEFDVRSELALGARYGDWTDSELRDYMLTEVINDRGLPIDTALAASAQGYGEQERIELNDKLREMTDGGITSTNQHAKVKAYIKERLEPEVYNTYFKKMVRKKDKDTGEYRMVEKESTDKAARADFLAAAQDTLMDPDVVDLIELVDEAGKASVAKYAKMAARASVNGRAQGAYLYAGAIQTKRFSSTGVQMHNLPRKPPEDVPAAVAEVMEHRIEGKVMHVLAALLRPTIKASEGRTIVWGDWSSVEARGMPWLAGAQAKLDLYRNGTDVYRVNAEHIFGTPYADVADDQRQIGKVAELSLQFGGAKGALRAMARQYGIGLHDGESDRIVHRWRAANAWAARFSNGLYAAFMRTILGRDSRHGPISYRQTSPLLPGTVSVACALPGGTVLYYHGIAGSVAFRFGARPYTAEIGLGKAFPHEFLDGDINTWDTEVVYKKSMPGGFRTDRIWHGLLAENVTQAICAALLRDCLARTDSALKRAKLDAFVIGHTHDELLLESSEHHAPRAKKVLQREMVAVPEWLSGFPLGCEVKAGVRYAK